jgi:FAD binding domain-containing protein/uncharacterized protein DUF433
LNAPNQSIHSSLRLPLTTVPGSQFAKDAWINAAPYGSTKSRFFVIRTQMVRAQMVVTRALEQGEITRDDKILVVGAGAAGAVAAMTCASCGLDTVIIDRKSRPFLRQAGCATRCRRTGASPLEEVLADYPDLEPADIQQALKYGAWLAQEEVVPGY